MVGGLAGRFNEGLLTFGEAIPEAFIDANGEACAGLVKAGTVIVWGFTIEAEGIVVPRADPFGRVDVSGLECLINLSAGEGPGGAAECAQRRRGETVLDSLQHGRGVCFRPPRIEKSRGPSRGFLRSEMV